MPEIDSEALQIAAQCWCDKETSTIEMDTRLANAVAMRIETWMNVAKEYARAANFYRSLLIKCGEAFGEAARTADDGTVMDSVLCLKVPELVQDLVNKTNN